MLPQFRSPLVYLGPLYYSFLAFCREKTAKDVKRIAHQRTFRPCVPGRAVMALLRNLDASNIQSVTVAKMTMLVAVGEPTFLDGIFGRKMSQYDFRPEGYGVVSIHGPIYFKWEMCVSEEGDGPVEGTLSITVGGWTSYDRFGSGIIKQCFEPQQAKKRSPGPLQCVEPQQAKKRSPATRSGFPPLSQPTSLPLWADGHHIFDFDQGSSSSVSNPSKL